MQSAGQTVDLTVACGWSTEKELANSSKGHAMTCLVTLVLVSLIKFLFFGKWFRYQVWWAVSNSLYSDVQGDVLIIHTPTCLYNKQNAAVYLYGLWTTPPCCSWTISAMHSFQIHHKTYNYICIFHSKKEKRKKRKYRWPGEHRLQRLYSIKDSWYGQRNWFLISIGNQTFAS